MLSMLAAIGFDPEIRGILVVATGAIVLFGSIWLILATNQGIRLAALISLAGFFSWMFIMGGFWWIRGIGFVGESVSWHVMDFNRIDVTESSVEPVHDLPLPATLKGEGLTIIENAHRNAGTDGLDNAEQIQAIVNDFPLELDPADPDFSELSPEDFADQENRNTLRVESATLSQLFSIAPDVVEDAGFNKDGALNGWALMNTAEAGEAQSTAGAAIVEHEGFDFESQAEFKFLDAFTTGGKPRLDRDIDPDCTFCADNLRRGWHWIANSARIKNPTQYAVVQLQAIDEEALIVEEGQAPRFPAIDEDAPIISVVMIRELGNLRFPPAMITLGSLFIFVALAYMLHMRDLATMSRVDEFEAENS